jgi:Glycosyl transferase family 2
MPTSPESPDRTTLQSAKATPPDSTSNAPEISLVILTKNEEPNIQRCISSAQPHCTDIHVLDSGSTDLTCKIAQSMGAEVTVHKITPFMITEQRNWALENLSFKNEWVLFLDADEAGTESFFRSIKSAIASSDRDAYLLAPRFQYQGTWLRRFMGFPNWHPRLVRQGFTRFEGGVWEQFSTNASVGLVSEPYLHFPNSKGLSDWIERHLRYATWEAQLQISAPKGGRNARSRRILGRLGGFRPPLVLAYHLLWRGGLLDGGSVWSYARRQLIYQLLIAEAVREARIGEARARS